MTSSGSRDLREVFNLLDSKERHITEDIKTLIQENLSSNKESWLITSLVDYQYASGSSNVVDILTEVRNPHDKHLLEKLHDGLKNQEGQLQTLQLLLQIICKHPIWLPKLVQMPIFKVILRILKVETDIPVLTTAVTIVAIVLPSVPTTVGSHLPDVFEIFNRLASFCRRKPAGSVPDVFLLHLQVAVYSLFHRLYGMFPYNFLAYLRHFYNKRENIPIFEEVVKPMLERVRLHPLLIVGTKEQETSTSRWKQMETQDVVVECARMSLDLVEGTWEELHCPILSSRYMNIQPQPHTYPQHTAEQGRAVASVKPQMIVPPTQKPEPEVVPEPSSNFWSPSEIVGLGTPPSSQRTTPAASLTEPANIQTSGPASSSFTPHPTPPVSTPRETPPISDESMSRQASQSSLQSRSNSDQKRLSAEIPTTIAPTGPFLTPVSLVSSVPPSPLRAEFTSTPPFGLIKTQPVLQAARELQFDQQDVAEYVDKSPEIQLKKPVGRKPLSANTNVSVSNLSHVMDELEVPEGSNAEDDDEVSELTSSTRSAHTVEMLTAESVAKFMKSVNRIRFNSLTASNSMELIQHKFLTNARSRSCPHLPKLSDSQEEEEEEEEEDELSRSMSVTSTFQLDPAAKNDNSVSVSFQLDSPDTLVSEQSSDTSNTSTITKTDTTSSSTVPLCKANSNDTLVGGGQNLGLVNEPSSVVNSGQCSLLSTSTTEASNGQQEVQLLNILRQVLNPIPSRLCRMCASKLPESDATVSTDNGSTKIDCSGPMFKSFSPLELLDRHMRLGGEIHAKELSQIPMTSQTAVSWTHFGGSPPVDEINILRGQLMLLHTQLMYERNKREQHAKRNRRLLRKIAHAKTVEEQNSAMESQLRQDEDTVRNMKVSIKLLLEENEKLKGTLEKEENDRLQTFRNCLKENEDLKSAKKELNTLLVRQREEHDLLREEFKEAKAKLFNTEKELSTFREHATANQKLKAQVLQLHKELLLQGELQQKCQGKLLSFRTTNNQQQRSQLTIATLQAEVKGLKDQLAMQTIDHDICKAQLKDRDAQLKSQEMSLFDVKKTVDELKSSNEDHLQSMEDKHEALARINQQLEAQVLKLFAEIEELKGKRTFPIPVRQSTSDTGTPPDGSGPGRPGEEERNRRSSDPSRRQFSNESAPQTSSLPAGEGGGAGAVDHYVDNNDKLTTYVCAPDELASSIRNNNRINNSQSLLPDNTSTDGGNNSDSILDDYVHISHGSLKETRTSILSDKTKNRSDPHSLMTSVDSAMVDTFVSQTVLTDNRTASIKCHTLIDSGYCG